MPADRNATLERAGRTADAIAELAAAGGRALAVRIDVDGERASCRDVPARLEQLTVPLAGSRHR